MRQPTLEDIYKFDELMSSPMIRQDLMAGYEAGYDGYEVHATDDGNVVYYNDPSGQSVAVGMEPVKMAQAPTETMTDAGPGSVKGIDQTLIQKALEAAGIGLEQAGRFLDSLGSVNAPLLGRITLADLAPFVGSMKEPGPSVMYQQEWQGTPKALQAAGRGEALTTGTGFARQMKKDTALAAAETAFEALPMARGIKRVAKRAMKASPVVAPVAGSIDESGNK